MRAATIIDPFTPTRRRARALELPKPSAIDPPARLRPSNGHGKIVRPACVCGRTEFTSWFYDSEGRVLCPRCYFAALEAA